MGSFLELPNFGGKNKEHDVISTSIKIGDKIRVQNRQNGQYSDGRVHKIEENDNGYFIYLDNGFSVFLLRGEVG